MTVRNLICSSTDEYLVSVSNKGMVNRAKRELSAVIRLDDDTLCAEFPDGTITSVGGDVNLFKCTCPSRSVCKHVLIALMLAYEQFKDKISETEEFAETPEIAEVKENPVEKTAPKTSKIPVDITVIPKVVLLTDNIFKVGITRLPETYTDKLNQYATLCHGGGFAELERLLMTSAKECELYCEKSALFRLETLIGCLSSVRLICGALQSGTISAERNFKQKYKAAEDMEIWGIGAEPWYTKSGFCGITAAFYSPEIQNFVTYTVSRPTDDIDKALTSVKRLKRVPGIWNLNEDIEKISRNVFRLKHAKLSGDGRLSSSETTDAQFIKNTCAEKMCINDFSEIRDFFTDYTDGEIVFAVLKISGFKNSEFDKITQTYSCVAEDLFNHEITLSIEYSKITANAVLEMEQFSKKRTVHAVSVAMTLTAESLKIRPFAVWEGGKVISIGFSEPSKKLSDFSKFFSDKK